MGAKRTAARTLFGSSSFFCLVSVALPPHTDAKPVAMPSARGGGAQSATQSARAHQPAQPAEAANS